MSESTETVTPPTQTPTETDKGEEYYKVEAQKAFRDRDAAKAELRKLSESGRVLTDEQIEKYKALETAAEKAEEDRKRKAGEFDTWRESITKKHSTELEAERQRAIDADTKWRNTHVGLAFAGASDLFGKEGLTIYSPKAAEKIFKEHVRIEDDGSVAVLDASGNVMVDAKTGKPASFSAGMRELIESLPDKADHLRGSGKAGSGNSGGSNTPLIQADVTELTRRANTGDKAAVDALRARRNNSNKLVMGSALSR
jgi:hypothetical protein